MPKSIAELRRQLSDIEPNELTYDQIGPSEVDLLRGLLDDEEAWMAARAVHALVLIDSDKAREAILAASASPRVEVRVAVASSAGALPPRFSDEVLARLLADSQIGVRKFAIKSISSQNDDALKRRITDIAASDPEAGLRRLAHEKAEGISNG